MTEEVKREFRAWYGWPMRKATVWDRGNPGKRLGVLPVWSWEEPPGVRTYIWGRMVADLDCLEGM